MRVIVGWVSVVLSAAALGANPMAAQARSCDEGRGAVAPDLGFDRPRRASRPGPRDAGPELYFATEPRITGVRAGGPAAGKLRNGDLLVSLDGAPITSGEAAARYAQLAPASIVRFAVRRDAEVREVTLVVSGRCVPFAPAPAAPPPAYAPPVAPVPESLDGELMPATVRLGFDLTCNECGRDRTIGGSGFRFREPPIVRVVQGGSAAARAGLRAGDALTHVDGVALASSRGWAALSGITPRPVVRLTYRRSGVAHEITVPALPR